MSDVTPIFDIERSETLKAAIARFNAEPTIASRFPITLKGRRLLDDVAGGCAECAKQVPPEYFRGAVATMGGDEPSLVSFDAHALCTDCNIISPVYGRVRVVEGRMRMETVMGGQWVYAYMTRDTFFGRLRFKVSKFRHLLKSSYSK